jgi:hypothetical protein|tara:strand:- start:366 stop:563 length:198 start_codon:yes stop_codon:yes gene_type:complete
MIYRIEGRYTYKVSKTVKADSKEQALAIAQEEPLCEWDCVEQDSYSECLDHLSFQEEIKDERFTT